MNRPVSLSSALLAALVLLSGCTVLDAASTRPVRSPSIVIRDGGVRHGRALPRATARATRVEAARYAATLDRALRLSGRQERAVRDLVTDRALDHMQRQRYADPRDLFPRHLAERTREGARWWDRTDRQIERVLTRPQRRAYRDLVRQVEVRDRRDRGKKHGHRHDRHCRHHDDDRRDRHWGDRDDDWDDDDWDDDRWGD